MKRTLVTSSLAIGVFLGSLSSAAQAEVLGIEPGVDFANSPTTIALGQDNQATYTFSAFSSGSTSNSVAGVSTSGSALVSASLLDFGQANAYPSGRTLPSNPVFSGPYKSFSQPAETLASSEFPYLGLKFSLSDGVHYGYAKLDDLSLASLAYQSTPGASITTGASITGSIPSAGGSNPVPAPASWAIFGLGLTLIGGGFFSRRRQSFKSAPVAV